MNAKEKIKAALETLGVKGSIRIKHLHNLNLWVVDVDGKYFGIYDTERNTFVD